MKQLDLALRTPVVARTLRDAPLVYVDVGAAVGVEEPWRYMLRAAELTRVVGFEPHPDNLAGIERLPNGAYHELAIGDTPGRATFYLHSTLSSLIDRSHQIGRELPTMEVEVETLHRLRDRGTVPSLDIVKTDTELADYQAVEGCGPYLDDEVLCVQCEFSFRPFPPERPFRDFDALLEPKGFLLYGLSTQLGGLGELGGGNLLYLRSVFDLLTRGDRATQRLRGIKLFVIALTLSHLDMAYVTARALGDAGVLDAAEAEELRRVALRYVYIPDTQSFRVWRTRAANLLGNMAAAVGGGFSRGVSTPSSNRLENYQRLIRSPGPLWRRDAAERLYESYYLNAARLAGLPTKSG